MRRISLIAGCLVAVAAIVTLASTFGGRSFTVHMTVHMAVVAIAAPLIALGLTQMNVPTWRQPTWLTPVLASLIELVVVWFWHVPAVRAAADVSVTMALIEVATFLMAGTFLWCVCLNAGESGEGRLAGTIGLLFTSMHMTLLGVLLSLAPRPLYGEGAVTCFGVELSAAADQQIGGVVMLMVGAVSYLIGGIGLLVGVLRIEVPNDAGRRQC